MNLKSLISFLILFTFISCSESTDEESSTTPDSVTYSVQISAASGGTVDNSGGSFDSGSTLTVTAIPNSGYAFINWSDDTTANPKELNVNSNLNLTANFEEAFTVSTEFAELYNSIDGLSTVGDNQILKSGVESVRELDLSNSISGIGFLDDLSGIENFTNLRKLTVDRQSLRRVDLSKNTKLEYVWIANNKLIEINLKNAYGFGMTTFLINHNKKPLKNLRILHITNFNERHNGRLFYNSGRRINNGFIRLDHSVLELSDRDIVSYSRKFNDFKGANKLINKLLEIIRKNQLDKFLNIDGIGETQLNSLRNFFSKNKNLLILNDLNSILNIQDQNFQKKGILRNKTFMFTGKLDGISRAEAKSLIEKNSGSTLSNVSKNLDFLVAGEKPTKSKLDQATKLGIKILSQDELKKLLDQTN